MSIFLWWQEPCEKCGKKKSKVKEEDDIICDNPDCDWKIANFFSERIIY